MSGSCKKVRDFMADRNARSIGRIALSGDAARRLEIDGYACHYCGETRALTIDHVVPRSKGGEDCLSNYVTACHSCNASKRNKSYDEFIEWREAELAAFVTMYVMADCL